MGVFILLTPGFPENENDTTCLPAFQQFALSVKKLIPPHEFVVIAFHYPFVKKDYSWNGIRVISIGGSNKPGLNRILTWVRAFFVLQSIKRKSQIIGVFSLWVTECALVGKFFARLHNLKHYIWLIGQDAKKSNQYVKRIKPTGANIIAMSDFLKEEYFRNHQVLPFMVAENGIHESAFPTLNTGERSIDILGVGSLIPLKRYDLFIEIIYEVQCFYPNLKVVIAGSGIDENNLREKVKSLSLENVIHFEGSIPHAAIFELMNQSKIFLHTSEYEGNSTVLMEALYSGCFSISSQALSNSETFNLQVLSTKSDFVTAIKYRLEHPTTETQRICFNTMDTSAKKILDLFLS